MLGNRVKTVENGVVTNYTSNNVNAYTAISGGMSFTPSYDGNGNMLNDDKHQYVYDYNSKMASVGDKSVTYKYDALGRRIAKNNTLFYYVGDQMVEESTDGAVTSYLYGNNIDEALQMSRKDEAYYYHTNHLGSTMGLTNKEGKIVEKVEYDVYGMPTFLDADGKVLAASTIGNNILFTGREYNAETGDYYFRARSLHPMVGRFMQKDLLGYIDGMNDYTYVLNMPSTTKDPYGNNVQIIGYGVKLLGLTMRQGIKNAPLKTSQVLEPGTNQAISGLIAQGNAKQILKGSGLGTLGQGGSVLANDETYHGPRAGQMIGNFAGGLIGGAIAGVAAGALFGGVGAVPGFFIGLGGSLIGGIIGEELGKGIDKWWENNHKPYSCDNPNDPPCRYNSQTGIFECSVSY